MDGSEEKKFEIGDIVDFTWVVAGKIQCLNGVVDRILESGSITPKGNNGKYYGFTHVYRGSRINEFFTSSRKEVTYIVKVDDGTVDLYGHANYQYYWMSGQKLNMIKKNIPEDQEIPVISDVAIPEDKIIEKPTEPTKGILKTSTLPEHMRDRVRDYWVKTMGLPLEKKEVLETQMQCPVCEGDGCITTRIDQDEEKYYTKNCLACGGTGKITAARFHEIWAEFQRIKDRIKQINCVAEGMWMW